MDAVIAARLRPIANADAASSFIDFSFFQVCRDAAGSHLRKQFISLATRPTPTSNGGASGASGGDASPDDGDANPSGDDANPSDGGASDGPSALVPA